MKVKTWVETSREVEVDIVLNDIRLALDESFAVVTKDRSGEAGPGLNRNDVCIALNNIAGFLNALTESHIRMLSYAQIDTVQKFLFNSANRFKNIGERPV